MSAPGFPDVRPHRYKVCLSVQADTAVNVGRTRWGVRQCLLVTMTVRCRHVGRVRRAFVASSPCARSVCSRPARSMRAGEVRARAQQTPYPQNWGRGMKLHSPIACVSLVLHQMRCFGDQRGTNAQHATRVRGRPLVGKFICVGHPFEAAHDSPAKLISIKQYISTCHN
jgi:hypothetical protein